MKQTYWLVSLSVPSTTIRLDKRITLTTLVLCCLGAMLALFSLTLGSYPVSALQIWQTLTGDAVPLLHTVLIDWRLPRVFMALCTGAALGMSGAIFQSLLRNPLGSPDVIGFNTGAYTGALITVILLKGSYLQMAFGSILGGCLTALLIYALAWQNGVARFRLIIVGIAVSASLHGVNVWLMMSSTLESAMTAAFWSTGSLNGMTWEKALPPSALCLLLMIFCLGLTRPMQLMEMGDELAQSLGIRVNKTRALLTISATALTAAATAMTGPVAFIALSAPPIAQRLTKAPVLSPLAAAATGGLLLLSADMLAQHAIPNIQLPVGIITVSLGGLYLVGLLVRETRKSTR